MVGEDGHRCALAVDDVVPGFGQCLFCPDAADAAVTGPSFCAGRFIVGLAEGFGRVAFEDAEGFFAIFWAGDQDMNVIGADVGGLERPVPATAGVSQRFQDRLATWGVEAVGGTRHGFAEVGFAGFVGFGVVVAGLVVPAVDGASRVSMDARAVAGEGDEVRQRAGAGPFGRGGGGHV